MKNKDMLKYLDEKGFIIQKSRRKINAIDSNFLTSGVLYQKLVLGDTEWIDGRPLEVVGNLVKDNYLTEEGHIKRYWKNYEKLTGSNPLETRWYTDPSHVSRDNSMNMIMLLGKLGHHEEVRKILFNIVKRGSFFQNTHTVKGERKFLPDLCGPEQYSVILRASTHKNYLLFLYPLFLFLDLFFLLSILVHVLKSKKDPTYASTVHHYLSAVLQTTDTIQTPFSWLAKKLFLNYRDPVPEFYDKEPIVSAMKYYSRSDYDPPIYETTARVVEYLKK